ncbi:hypothetical protein F4805DRAFT_104610 [Annulohypoxylon moriforme]|nr:hypothetical protein F4805DRAFT_104610 [Annulohypoxylon moriforme]
MLPVTLLLFPLFALAAPPPSQGDLEIRSKPIKPGKAYTWTPTAKGQFIYTNHNAFWPDLVNTDGKDLALCDDCFYLEDYLYKKNGTWQMNGATNPNDPNDWNLLDIHGTCSLLVKNSAPTKIGNMDVGMFMSAGNSEACLLKQQEKVEAQGSYHLGNTRIDFFIRNTAGLDLSNVVGH